MSSAPKISNFSRLKQLTAVVARHGLHQVLNKDIATDEAAPFSDNSNSKPNYAVRFRHLLEDLGATYIKFGQILSTRPDLLSPEIIRELSKLQDHCPPMTPEQTATQLQEAFGQPLEEIFSEFDHTPIASASISQVHRATLKTGEQVAVKIQRPGLLQQVSADIDILYYLASILEAIVKASGFATPKSLVREFESSLLRELDFRLEVQTIKRFYENAQHRSGVIVPKVYDEYCNDNIIVMDYLSGRSLREIDPQKEPELATKLACIAVDTTLAQVFEDGLYHADPHPGNLLALENGNIGLLDFGSVGELTPAMRDTCLAFLMSIVLQDAPAMTRLIFRICSCDQRLEIRTLQNECSEILHRHLKHGGKLGEISAAKVLEDVSELITKHQLKVPPEYALVVKAGLTVEGVMMALDPKLDIVERAKPYLAKVLNEHFSTDDIGNTALRKLFDFDGIFNDLPTSLSQIIMDLEHGNLRITVNNPQLEKINNSLEILGLLFVMGMAGSALISGSFFLFGPYDKPIFGLPLVAISAIFVALLIFGCSIAIYFIRGKFPKLPLSSIAKKLPFFRHKKGGRR